MKALVATCPDCGQPVKVGAWYCLFCERQGGGA